MPPVAKMPELKVGDRVVHDDYAIVIVEWMGESFVGCSDGKVYFHSAVKKVVEYPERWINVFSNDPHSGRIGVLHLRTDGTTEMLPG